MPWPLKLALIASAVALFCNMNYMLPTASAQSFQGSGQVVVNGFTFSGDCSIDGIPCDQLGIDP